MCRLVTPASLAAPTDSAPEALLAIIPLAVDVDTPPSEKEARVAPLEDKRPQEVPALVQLARLRQRFEADQGQGPSLVHAVAMPASANTDSRAQTHDHLLVARRRLQRSQHGPIKQCRKLESIEDHPQGPRPVHTVGGPAGANADGRAQTHDHLLMARRRLQRSQHGPIKQCQKMESE
jgi:hypothetical protein